MNGWIKLYRRILECFLWLDDEPFCKRAAWIDLLLLANHRNKQIMFDGKPLIIRRGQYLTSVRKLSSRWGWSKDKTLRFLKILEMQQMIHRESDNKRTLLTIVNYEVYQGECDSDKDSDKDTDKDTDKPQLKKDKNVKNINKKKLTFHNLDMRHEYDFEEMERELLKRAEE